MSTFLQVQEMEGLKAFLAAANTASLPPKHTLPAHHSLRPQPLICRGLSQMLRAIQASRTVTWVQLTAPSALLP